MTLPVSSVVNVSISLAALAAGPRSFGSLLILGTTTGVIATIERMREYSGIDAVAEDYSVDDPEYKAALAYFGQSPKPRTLYIGYWDKTGSESVQAAVAECLQSLKWYGLSIAADLTDIEVDAVAALIEASDPVRKFGYTTQQEDSLSATSTTDTAYKLKNKNYRRTFVIFSSDNPYAAASVFGRAFSVNFMGTNTTITLKFKQLPGIAAEDLKMLKAVKIRLYPNKTQETQINKLLGCYRFIYNKCLNKKITSYTDNKTTENLTTLGYYIHHDLLKDDEFIWLREQNSKVLKQSLIDMLSAYNNFFKYKKGYPKYKSKHDNKQSCRFELS